MPCGNGLCLRNLLRLWLLGKFVSAPGRPPWQTLSPPGPLLIIPDLMNRFVRKSLFPHARFNPGRAVSLKLVFLPSQLPELQDPVLPCLAGVHDLSLRSETRHPASAARPDGGIRPGEPANSALEDV